jgi:hypothetical protein
LNGLVMPLGCHKKFHANVRSRGSIVLVKTDHNIG